MKRGEVEFTIDDKKRGLINDNYALLIASKKYGGDAKAFREDLDNKDSLAYMALIYGMAVSWCESKNIKPDFTINDIDGWLEKLGGEVVAGFMVDLFKIPEAPKNSESPKEKEGIAH